MPADPTRPGLQARPEPLGPSLLRRDGERRRKSPFPTKSRRARPLPRRDRAAAARRAGAAARADARRVRAALPGAPRAPASGRGRSRRCASGSRTRSRAFGDVPLRDLERMSRRDRLLAGDAARALALRDRAGAPADARRRRPLGLHGREPGQARRAATASRRRGRCAPSRREELEAIAAELSPMLPAAARRSPPRPGCGPEEWQALERRDVDRAARRAERPPHRLRAARWSSSARPAAAAARCRSRARALDALDALPPRLDTPLLFPAPRGGLLDLDNFRRREWAPAIEASGVRDARRGSTTCARRSPPTRSPPGVGIHAARPDHGHQRADDRAPLRGAARRRDGVDRDPARCARWRARPGRERQR